VLDRFGIRPETKAALYDLYVELGPPVLDYVADFAEGFPSPSDIGPEDLAGVRRAVVDRYLQTNHPRWEEGDPTESLYRPRELKGRASGVVVPMGRLSEDDDSFAGRLLPLVEELLGNDQPVPHDGILVLGKNAHFGGRWETFSFDVVDPVYENALALATAQGRQHTVPGSAGETSGTLDSGRKLALIWEVQPNVLKPSGETNSGIAKAYRRHRNWHVITLLAAIKWLQSQDVRIYVLRGAGLAPTHQVNDNQPVSETITALHDRTVERVASFLFLDLTELTADDGQLLLDSEVMNTALTDFVSQQGTASAIRRLSARPAE
jgi:hypothetical protein